MLGAYMVVIASAAFGQSSDLTHTNSITQDLISPARMAADGSGGIYVTDPRVGAVLHYDNGGAWVATHPIPETPVGIAMHADGAVDIFISLLDGRLARYDDAFVWQEDLVPDVPLVMERPNGMEIHPVTGDLYVVDSGRQQVLVFAKSGGVWSFARAWGIEGSGLGEFESSQDIAIDSALGHVLVTDADNFRIQVFDDTTGLLLYKFGYKTLYMPGTTTAWVARTAGIAVDACGNIYVSDALMGTVRAFSSAGQDLDPLAPPVTYGTGAGEVRIPCDVMIDGGVLHVASTNNSAIEVFEVACTMAAAVAPPGSSAASRTLAMSEQDVSPSGRRKSSAPRELIVRPPDNPFAIVEAIHSGSYTAELDLNSDGCVDQSDLEVAVGMFGGADVSDFHRGNGPGTAGEYPFHLEPPHMADNPVICGRCHSMEDLPGGMLSALGQENLCLSCHTAGGEAMHKPIRGIHMNNSHPRGIPADEGDVMGPGPDSPLADHLDNGGIRCGTCHNQHSSEDGEPYLRATIGDASLCGECHVQAAEWANAGHSDVDSTAFNYPTGPGRESCAQCHSGLGHIDFAAGVPQAERRTDKQVHSCFVCHGVHENGNDELLRVYGEVTLPGGHVLDRGHNANCMSCHNGRYGEPNLDPAGHFSTPHYANGAVVLEGLNGVDFGATLTNSRHTTVAGCTDCHMAPSPADGQPGAGKVGGHSFNMVVHDPEDPDFGFENIENSCNVAACHGGTGGVGEINRLAYGDFDGDGIEEGVQDEVQGLLDLVVAGIEGLDPSVQALDHYPYWDFGVLTGDDLVLAKQAAWNFDLIKKDYSLGIHNTDYTVGLLQVTYEQLSGGPVPGAALRYTPAGFSATIVEITEVIGSSPVRPGGAWSINFTIENDLGEPIDIDDLNRLRLNVSGPSYNYQRVIYSDGNAAHFVQNMDGTYTYSGDPFPTNYMAPVNDSIDLTEGEMTGDPLVDGTYTAMIETRRVFGSIRKAGDATFDFVVDNDGIAPPPLAPRQFVMQENCNACHLDLQMHGGGRFSVTGCVLCHTRGAEDRATDPPTTPGTTIQFGNMIHKIHSGHGLRSVEATSEGADPYRYEIIGYRDSVHDFSDVGFPRMPGGVTECDACHGGAAQEPDILTNIERLACGSCHDDIDFTTGTILDQGHPDVADGLLTAADLNDPAYRVFPGGINHTFPDDTACSACHGPGMVAAVEDEHLHPTDPAAEGTGLTIEIVDVGGMTGGGGLYFVAGDFPAITFRLTNGLGNPVALVDGDSTVVDRVAFVVAGPTSIYQHVIPGEDQSRVRPWNSGAMNVDNPAGNWIDNFPVDGTYTYIFEPTGASSKSTAWPAVYQAARNALPNQGFPYEEGWGQLYTPGGILLDDGTYTVIAYARRKTVVANASEPAVVDTYDILYGADLPIVPYSGTVTDDKCNTCHGNLAFHGHARAGVRACLACHTPGVQINDAGVENNLDMRVMIHKIHNGKNLSVPYILAGDHGTHDYSETLIPSMPGEAAECEVCHANDNWKTPPVRADMQTWMTACTSCHDTAEVADHADFMTLAGTFTELCSTCHGDGAAYSVETVHKTP